MFLCTYLSFNIQPDHGSSCPLSTKITGCVILIVNLETKHITEKRTIYQLKVDVNMLNTVKSVLADVLSVSPLSEQRLCHANADQNYFSQGLVFHCILLKNSAYFILLNVSLYLPELQYSA